MTSKAQRDSARRNGARSQGPKTERGKAITCRNAVKHGLLSTHALLPDEDVSAFAVFADGLRAELAPSGPLEALLVDRIITNAWRLRRVIRIEREILESKRDSGTAMFLDGENLLGRAFLDDCRGSCGIESVVRYEGSIDRALFRSLHELQRLQAARRGQDVPAPGVLDVDVSVGCSSGHENLGVPNSNDGSS